MQNLNSQKKKAIGRAAVVTLQALMCLTETVVNIFDFAFAFGEAGYGASGDRINRIMERNQNDRLPTVDERMKMRCAKLLYRLRRDGLVREVTSKDGLRKFMLTAKGLRYKVFLKKNISRALIKREYPKEPSADFIIISFDIAERERGKRNWLRAALQRLSYSKIQQSVWIGKIKIPKEFVEDLRKHNLIEQIEIFQAVKLGTLSSE